MENYRYFNLDESNRKLFYDYCWKHGFENDESFLPVDSDFELKPNRPGLIVLDERNKVQGAACLMLDESYANMGKARFSILHSVNDIPEILEGMFKILSSKAREKNIDSIFLQIPESRTGQIETLKYLGFKPGRETMHLSRPKMTVRKFHFSPTFEWLYLDMERDAQLWSDIINICYEDRPEHIPYTPEMLREDYEMDDTFDGCGALLINQKKPIGLYYTSLVAMKELWIGHLCVLPGFRGMGLGKNLLRKCIAIGNDIGVECALSFDSENEKALGMCLTEDFDLVERYIRFEIHP